MSRKEHLQLPGRGRQRAIAAIDLRFRLTIPIIRTNRIMHGHQEGSIRKRPFDLNIMDGNLDAWHDVSPAEHLLAELHELCHAVLAITDEFLQLKGKQGNRFRLIELKAPGESLLSEEAQVGEQELVLKRKNRDN